MVATWRWFALALAFSAGTATAAIGEASQPFDVRDLLSLKRIIDLEASPDGRAVVYTVQSADVESNEMQTSVWLLDPASPNTTPRQLAGGPQDHAASWSADGRYVYFLSTRSGLAQVWRISATGKDAAQVTSLPLDVGSFRVSPRADRIFVSMRVFRHCLDLGCTKQNLFKAAQSPGSGIIRKQLFVRHWNDWQDGRRDQLFSIALDKRGLASAEPVKLSIDIEGDIPDKPFGGREDYAVSPDGQKVAFSERDAGAKEPWIRNADVYQAMASGGERAPNGRPLKDADPVGMTRDNYADDLQPAFSPDGSQLAYLAADRPNFQNDRLHLVLLNLATGEKRAVTQNWDRSIDCFAWTSDAKHLIALTDNLGQRTLWRIDARSASPEAITGVGTVEEFSVAGNRVFFVLSTLGSPPELYSSGLDGGKPMRLTRLNDAGIAQRDLGQYEPITFDGWNHETVHGFFVKPARFQPDRKYPLIVMLHDGPHQSLGNAWNWRLNSQIFAAAGFAVLGIDFHGSSGYGQEFGDSINGDVGGKPLDDLKSGLDFALAQYPWLEEHRMCALGEGYGGYLVNFIAGQWPRRFRCLVNHAGVFDNRSSYYTTDELSVLEGNLAGAEFENPVAYSKQNPIDYVKNWRTPMFISHGQLDSRVAYSQGLAAFTALQRVGWPGELLIFPDEGHWISKPANIAQWYDSVIGWLKTYTR